LFSRFERLIAYRYLRSKRKEGFVSVMAIFSFIGIMLGVAALIIVMSVMNGFHTELVKRILGVNAHITIMSNSGLIDNYQQLSEDISKIAGVVKVSPVVRGQVLAAANNQHSGAVVQGISLADLKKKPLIAGNIKLGNLDDMAEWGGIAIGSRMSKAMNLLPGDIIRFISPKTTDTFVMKIPRMKEYKVAAVFDVGMTEYDSSFIFMPIELAKIFFETEKSVNAIEIFVDNPDNAERLSKEIYALTKHKYDVVDWQRSNEGFFNALKTERVVMFIILTLIIVIAAFNVISGMVMLVIVKGKEIAILRTMGASRGAILRIFFLTGASIGVIGTIFGYILGVSFALNIEEIRQWVQGFTGTNLFDPVVYYLSHLTADVKADQVTLVVIVSLIISFLAPIYPAWRAAKTNPADGVRG